MVEELHIKRIELTDSKKAVIKSNWRQNVVDIEIYIKEISAVYTGSCSQEALRKKQDLNIKYDAIKDSLTSAEVQENVNYELDYKKLKFSIVSQQMCDSDSSFGEIVYVKFDLKSLNLTEIAALSMQLVDEIFDYNQTAKKFKAEQIQCKKDLKEMLDRYKELAANKMEFDKTTLQDVTSIINSKKTRISVLERKLQNFADIKSNKFANLSSDFDQSDLSIPEVKVVKKSSKTILSSSSDDDQQANPQPSTSTAQTSPAHLKIDSSHNSPKKVAQRRTPRKAGQSSNQPIFQFTKFHDSDDSMEELQPAKSRPKLKTPKKTSNHESIFANMKIKVTPKGESFQEQNPSSAELFIPKTSARRRLHSSSSDNSSQNYRKKSSTPDFVEPAQLLDFEKSSPEQLGNESSKNQEPKSISEELFKSDDEMQFTQNLDLAEVEEVENSQPFDSPSIFETYAKRKLRQSPQSASKRIKTANKSKFSDDTIDILADDDSM